MKSSQLHSVFSDFLRKYGDRKIAVTTHREADLDAIASCFAVCSVLPDCEILLIDNPDDEVDLLAAKLGVKTKLMALAKKEDYAGLVIVDSSTSALVKGFDGWNILCIVDHHRKAGKDLNAEFEVTDEESPSTSEILAMVLPRITKEVAFALSVGIISDTAQFNSARVETFEMLAKLMRLAEAKYKELLYYAEPPKSLSKKIAIAKSVQKMDFIEYKGFIVATSIGKSNESDAASMLASKLDVAMVAKKDTKEKGATRLSGRVNKNSEIRLNEVMMKVGAELGGKGGGHYKAAGARVMAKPEEALAKCIAVLKEWIDNNSQSN